MNAKNELMYILVTRLLESAAEAGVLTPEERDQAEAAALERYGPETVWE